VQGESDMPTFGAERTYRGKLARIMSADVTITSEPGIYGAPTGERQQLTKGPKIVAENSAHLLHRVTTRLAQSGHARRVG